MRCKAKAKRTGERCKNSPVTGKEVCRMHGAGGGAPIGSANAFKHGAYETLMREQLPEEQREVFDAVPVETGLEAELRILRFKLLRLIGDVGQNVVAGFNVKRIKADEPTKAAAIARLIGEIRQVVKEMRGESGADDPLAALVRDWEAGMISEGILENRPQPETA